MTTRKNEPVNRWGCKPEGETCHEHKEARQCKHGCIHAKKHQCKGGFDSKAQGAERRATTNEEITA